MSVTILHIIVGLNVGGAELMLKRLIESNRNSARYHHIVVSLTGLGVIGAQLRSLGIETHALDMKSAASLPIAMFRLTRLIRRLNPDIVQTWMYHADLLGGSAARLAGKKNVIWGVRTTNVTAGSTMSTTAVMRVCAHLSRWIPKVIVCAADRSRQVHQKLGYDGSRMTVIANGFDLSRLVATADERSELRASCGFEPDQIVIGLLGRFNRAKDQGNFVRAAGRVALSHPDVRFLLVGRALDASNPELADWIKETGFGDRFVLLGERSDVAACLSAMDVFCLSSRTEGFPNVVGEAMAMGVPCVVTDVGDAAMLVADTGYVVPKEDSAALADGLKKMLELAPERRAALGEKARQRITDCFTLERARQRFESIYDSLTKTEES